MWRCRKGLFWVLYAEYSRLYTNFIDTQDSRGADSGIETVET